MASLRFLSLTGVSMMFMLSFASMDPRPGVEPGTTSLEGRSTFQRAGEEALHCTTRFYALGARRDAATSMASGFLSIKIALRPKFLAATPVVPLPQ